MAFFRKVEEPARCTLNLCCSERFHALSDRDSKILFTVDDKQRRFPVTHEFVGREFFVIRSRFLTLPVGSTQIPVHKEQFLGRSIHGFEIEYPTVGDHLLNLLDHQLPLFLNEVFVLVHAHPSICILLLFFPLYFSPFNLDCSQITNFLYHFIVG